MTSREDMQVRRCFILKSTGAISLNALTLKSFSEDKIEVLGLEIMCLKL